MTLKADVALTQVGSDEYYRHKVEVVNSDTPIAFALADTVQLDAFSRLRVSQAHTLFDSQQEYGLNTATQWDCAANGTLSTASSDGSAVNGSNAVGPTNSNTRMTPITVSTTSGHYAVLQSRQYTRYIPGKSHLVLLTGIFSPGTVANTDARAGYFDSANGIFLKVTNGVAGIVRRTSTSGAAVDTEVIQSSWNVDKFDGTGVSGLTLDLTKTNILFIQAQWLGVGAVVIGFDIEGVLYPAHQLNNANSLTVPYTQTFNLPVRLELRNTGASAGATIQFVCCSVQSEGGEDQRGFPRSAPIGIVTTGVTTRRPVLSIRPKATYNSRTNRAQIKDLEFQLRATTNDSYFEVVVGGAVTIGAGAATWVSVGSNSCAEYCTDADTITGGLTTISGFANAGSGSTAGMGGVLADLRNPLVLSQIDALTANQIVVSLVCTSFSGTSNITRLANWHEQTV